MVRRLKAPPSAGWLHVMDRADPAVSPAASIDRLVAAWERLPLDLHAYCFLPSHFHLLVRADPVAARAAAASIHPSAPGPCLTRVQWGRHLMAVSRYVHLNPVHAGLTSSPEAGCLSSLRAYFGGPEEPAWLTTDAVLGLFGTIGARHRYRAYVRAGLDPGTRDGHGRPRWGSLFGEASELENFSWRIEPGMVSGFTEPQERSQFPAEDLARQIAHRFDVPIVSLRSPRTGGMRAALARGALVSESRAWGGCRLASLSAWMGYGSPAAAASAAERFDRWRAATAFGRARRAPQPAPSPWPCRPSDTPASGPPARRSPPPPPPSG